MGGLHHSNTQNFRRCDPQVRDDDDDDDGVVARKIGKNSCELCHEKARVFCAADEAQLCLACDHKVHSANFLVSKHSRDVLCAACGALTLSAHSGPRIDHRTRHCVQCADDDVSSNESRNSSCCTESNYDGEVTISHALKRRAIVFLEEGCGDSEDIPHHSSPTRKRVRTCLHTSKNQLPKSSGPIKGQKNS